MKICFYCDTIFSFGGVQRVLAVIAKALSIHHDVTILTLDSPSVEDMSMYDLGNSTIKIQYISYSALPLYEYLPCKTYSLLYKKILPHTPSTSRWYGRSSFPGSQRKRLINKLNAEAYDIVVGVHAFLSIRLANVRHQLHAPVVIGWMHNSYQAFFEMRPGYLEGLKTYFQHQMQLLDDVIVLTHTDAELYKNNLQLLPKVLYNPLTIIPQKRSDLTEKRFLSIGRFSPKHKGFDILIEGFALFAEKDKEWTLDIVGEGPEEPMLRKLIADHGLEQRITIHPFTKEIHKHYVASSVYVLSSRWEGFPLVLAEAMAYGLPVIASDIPIVKEVLDKKDNSIIFPKENTVELAKAMAQISSCQQIHQMGAISYQYSQTLQLPAIIEQWEKLLSSYDYDKKR